MDDLRIATCTKKEWDEIVRDFDEFWDVPLTRGFHNPILLNEFGNTAFVLNNREGTVIAYLFGFFSQSDESVAYVHLVATRRPFRRRGLATRLYEHFGDYARRHGRTSLKAITSVDNMNSLGFHPSIGMTTERVKDYAGIGQDRVILKKKL